MPDYPGLQDGSLQPGYTGPTGIRPCESARTSPDRRIRAALHFLRTARSRHSGTSEHFCDPITGFDI
jgi:hypothetical protein